MAGRFFEGEMGPSERGRLLQRCPGSKCERDLVQPIEWEEIKDVGYEILFECPNCGWSAWETHDYETLKYYDKLLDAGEDALLKDYQDRVKANMTDETNRFIRALNAGHILPEDTGRIMF